MHRRRRDPHYRRVAQWTTKPMSLTLFWASTSIFYDTDS